MASRDLVHNLAVVQLLAPIDKAHTNWKSSLLDTAGFESVSINLSVGAVTGEDGSNYLTVVMEESDTTADADFTTVTGLDIQGPGTFAYNGSPNFTEVSGSSATVVINDSTDAGVVYPLGYHGGKRYVRLKGTYTGTGISAGLVAVTGLMSHALSAPVVSPAAVSAT